MSTKQIQKSIVDIYSYDKQLQGIFKKIERDLPKNTVELIYKYDREMINTSKTKGTRRKHLQTLYVLSNLLDKEWNVITKDDVDILVSKIMERFAESNGQESNYSYDHKKILKIFFRWLKLGSREFNDVGDFDETKKVKLGKIRDKIAREDLITEEGKEKLLKACSGNIRDRALIDVQCESEIRPGELLTLKIKHVKFDKYDTIIHVDGKTGARPIRLIQSIPNLASWMDVHPLKEDFNSPLWVNLSKKSFGTQMSSASARQIVKRVSKKANISKRIYLNLFRHSEALIQPNFSPKPN